MNKKTIAKLAIAGSIGFSAVAAPTAALATPENEEEFDQRIEELNAEQSDVEERLSSLEEEIQSNEEEADELVAQMAETQDLLDDLQKEIAVLQEAIEEREERLESQARAVQVTGEAGSIVNFLLEAESFSDIFARFEVVSTLVSANQGLLQEQLDDKELVVEKEEETVAKQEEQMLLAAELENNKAELEEQTAEQESLVASIAAERAEVEDEREEYLAEQRAAEERRQEIEAARAAASEAEVLGTSTSNDSESASDSSEEVSTSSSDESSSTAEAAEAEESSSAPAPAGGSVASIAHSLTGSPYVYGGTSPSGFDCSGFITYVFNQAGARSLPRTAAGMYGATTRISRDQAQPGDLVFFSQGGGIDHAGIYLGGGNFIGAQTSTGVAVASINSGYWSNYVAGFGR